MHYHIMTGGHGITLFDQPYDHFEESVVEFATLCRDVYQSKSITFEKALEAVEGAASVSLGQPGLRFTWRRCIDCPLSPTWN
jgi:hypothetical protein